MNNSKPHKKSKTEKKQVLFILLVYCLDLILLILPFSRKIVINLSEVFYFLISLVILSFIIRTNKKKLTAFFLWTITAFFGIYLLQVFSINNNIIFGSCWFGGTFSHQIAGVPYIISIFWIVILFSAIALASKITSINFLRILFSSIFVVILDLFLEPVAMKLDYWQWENKSVPLQNYVIWFIISIIFSTFLIIFKLEPRSFVGRSFFLIQLAILVLINIFL